MSIVEDLTVQTAYSRGDRTFWLWAIDRKIWGVTAIIHHGLIIREHFNSLSSHPIEFAGHCRSSICCNSTQLARGQSHIIDHKLPPKYNSNSCSHKAVLLLDIWWFKLDNRDGLRTHRRLLYEKVGRPSLTVRREQHCPLFIYKVKLEMTITHCIWSQEYLVMRNIMSIPRLRKWF